MFECVGNTGVGHMVRQADGRADRTKADGNSEKRRCFRESSRKVRIASGETNDRAVSSRLKAMYFVAGMIFEARVMDLKLRAMELEKLRYPAG